MNILKSVEGLQGRFNDVLFHPSSLPNVIKRVVCFFGGDTQDYEASMLKDSNSCIYAKWSLENTLKILSTKFPSDDIFIIRTSKFASNHFACYNNFVPVDHLGSPKHNFSCNSLHHLNYLLTNSRKLLNLPEDFNKITLIGFSKGCVVLNQFLYAFHSLDQSLIEFTNKITDIYWLDAGHCGGSNIWITKNDILEQFAKLNINVHVHVTPYQIKCITRPWIGKEEKIFTETLIKHGVTVQRTVHFDNLPGQLDWHFELLNTFK